MGLTVRGWGRRGDGWGVRVSTKILVYRVKTQNCRTRDWCKHIGWGTGGR